MATRGRPENDRGSFFPLQGVSCYCLTLVQSLIVLLISAKSLVLLKNYVKILKLAAHPGQKLAVFKLLHF